MNRKFKDSLANRNSSEGKLDYEGFNSPVVDWRFAQYMHKHRLLEDGTYRDSDNWQHGGKEWLEEVKKSLVRHTEDYKMTIRGYDVVENGRVHDIEEILCGIRFNVNSHLHELLKNKKEFNRSYNQ